MKSTNVVTFLGALGLAFGANSAQAQALSPARVAALHAVLQTNRPVAPPSQTNAVATAIRPAVPAQNVKDLVKDFKTARQEFLESQQELLRQLKSATEEQRTAIREQLKENLNDFRELQRTHIQELREQTRDVINNVPAVNDVINSTTRDLLRR